ncbi:MAG: hypothetical protein SGPRY_001226 [Prymnesium sp.]
MQAGALAPMVLGRGMREDRRGAEIVGWKGGRTDLGLINASVDDLDQPLEQLLDESIKPIDFRAGGGVLYANHQ